MMAAEEAGRSFRLYRDIIPAFVTELNVLDALDGKGKLKEGGNEPKASRHLWRVNMS